jgi:hypothetical protein
MTDSTDKPRKTLSITRKPATQGTDTASTTSATVKRTGGKRIITRAELPNVQRPGKQPPKPPKKPASRKPRQPPKPKKTPPSVLKARELNDRLNGFRVWLDYLPLAIGVEKDLFRLVNDEQFPGASKRVVQRLLHQHTHDRRYLENVCRGGVRWALNGEEAGAILPAEQEYAGRAL